MRLVHRKKNLFVHIEGHLFQLWKTFSNMQKCWKLTLQWPISSTRVKFAERETSFSSSRREKNRLVAFEVFFYLSWPNFNKKCILNYFWKYFFKLRSHRKTIWLGEKREKLFQTSQNREGEDMKRMTFHYYLLGWPIGWYLNCVALSIPLINPIGSSFASDGLQRSPVSARYYNIVGKHPKIESPCAKCDVGVVTNTDATWPVRAVSEGTCSGVTSDVTKLMSLRSGVIVLASSPSVAPPRFSPTSQFASAWAMFVKKKVRYELI